MAKSNGPFMVIFGDEDFLLDRFIYDRKALWSKRNVVQRDCDGLTEIDVVSVLESTDMFDDRPRAVVLDNAQDMKSSASKPLAKYLADKDPKDLSCVVLVVIRSKSVPAAWSEAVKKGVSVEHTKPKPWETEKFQARIDTESGRHGLQFAPGMLELFHKFVRDDLRVASNELVKLSYVVGPDKLIKSEHIALVTASHVTAAPYEVAEAAFSKDVVKAMKLMSIAYRDSGEGCLVPVTYALMRQVEQTLIILDMLSKQDPIGVIAARLSLNEYVCKRKLPVAQKHNVPTLLGHMNKLCKLDSQVKGPARSKRTLVELAVLSIAS